MISMNMNSRRYILVTDHLALVEGRGVGGRPPVSALYLDVLCFHAKKGALSPVRALLANAHFLLHFSLESLRYFPLGEGQVEPGRADAVVNIWVSARQRRGPEEVVVALLTAREANLANQVVPLANGTVDALPRREVKILAAPTDAGVTILAENEVVRAHDGEIVYSGWRSGWANNPNAIQVNRQVERPRLEVRQQAVALVEIVRQVVNFADGVVEVAPADAHSSGGKFHAKKF